MLSLHGRQGRVFIDGGGEAREQTKVTSTGYATKERVSGENSDVGGSQVNIEDALEQNNECEQGQLHSKLRELMYRKESGR